jgi:hypothetical protein
MNHDRYSVETSLSETATRHAYELCEELLNELKEDGLKLTGRQHAKLYHLVAAVAQASVGLCKNTINDL